MCTQCVKNTYKVGTGVAPCLLCPNNSISPPGSDEVADCVCNAIAVRLGTLGECVACESGKFKSSAISCTQCGTLRGDFQEELETCLCIAGYGENAAGVCEMCAKDTYTDIITGEIRMAQKFFACPDAYSAYALTLANADKASYECINFE